MFMDFVLSFHDFQAMMLCCWDSNSQCFSGIMLLWPAGSRCPTETAFSCIALGTFSPNCVLFLCIGQWSRISWFSWLIFSMYWRFTQWNVSDFQALTKV
jgi:hypothetical protein